MSSHSSLIGVAGEHYVLSELLRRGFIAALAPTGAPNADIVVTDRDCAHLCSIQVKTRSGKGAEGGWHMKAKHEDIRGPLYFYCFVDFRSSSEERPLVYVMPSNKVAEVIEEAHRMWLGTLGKKGQPHKDGPMRRLLPNYEKTWTTDNPYPAGWMNEFRDAWHLLNLERTDPETPIEDDGR
jgi:hypothetical protein